MSALVEIGKSAATAATDACWRQWQLLAAGGSGWAAGCIIDPEALVLMSLALRQHERRLEDHLAWWARQGAALMSVSDCAPFSPNTRSGLARK